MPGEIPLPLSLSVANRTLWATNPYDGRLDSTTELKRITHDPTKQGSHHRYAQVAHQPLDWRNYGNFVIDLDNFLLQNYPLLEPESLTALHFGLLGGQGLDQKIVKPISRVCSLPGHNHFHFLLGNNFGREGVTSPRSDIFLKSFHDLFQNSEYFALLGKEDYHAHRPSWFGRAGASLYKAMCQVYHSYLGKQHSIDPTQDRGYKNHWHMPYRYYALVSEATNTVFICIDSNTFMFDLEQQNWLYQTYHKFINQLWAQGIRNFILVSHHPLEYFTDNKNNRNEWEEYRITDLPQDETIPTTPTLLHFKPTQENPSNCVIRAYPNNVFPLVGEFIKDFLQTNNLRFNVVFAGYEPILSYKELTLTYLLSDNIDEAGQLDTKNGMVHQFISGCAGRAPQPTLTLEQTTSASFTDRPLFRNTAPGYLLAYLNKNKLVVEFFSNGEGKPLDYKEIIFGAG